ncbi:nitrous oxide reductase family maturation protein NosD [Exiguobacterium sp. SL-9]|uniref:right-handed parallel beta-helix repeat-containing protein n=1 Tax=Exiguobacterium sp. SL-9 TaxID=2510963 RepID=UPI00103F7FE5|nr:NosD domain-containing protein [Exiguobacterium sp. SL-9]TCI20759.1 nitrous oxidase accessory-like protein [Exiguobacterium sp. SL-9]
MRQLGWLLALWFFAPAAVHADTGAVSLEAPIVIQSNETFNGEGKRFSSCERPAFQLEGTGAVLENVEIEQCNQARGPAVFIVGLGHQVIDVTIEAAGTGIAVEDSYGVRLIRPNVTGKGREDGISIHDSEATVIKGASIDHVRDGIYIENGTGHELVRPLVTNSRYGIHLMFPTDVSILSPNLHHNKTGAMVMGTERVRIENGQIYDQVGASGMGLMLFEAVETSIRANAIYGNRVGIYAEKSEWTAIHDNGVNGNDIGLRLKRANGMTLTGNDVTNNRYPVVSFEAADNVVVGNDWGGQTLDLTRDGQSEIPYRADPYLFLLADSYEAFELLYGAPGLTVLERVLRSPDEVTLTDVSPRATSFELEWQGTVGATVLSGLLILLWRFGRKQDDYL